MTPPNMHAYLSSLVGETLHTFAEEKPNEILGIERSSVRVGTAKNPSGSLVGIALIQGVVDRLYAGEEVVLNPRTRRGFVTAVLRRMDGIEILRDPIRARLG